MNNYKKLIYIFIPIMVGIIFTLGLNCFLDKENDKLMNSKDISIIKNAYGSDIKDKGVVLTDYVNNNNDILLQGSSELGADVDQIITRTFPIEGFNHEITTFGRANVQYLEHATILGSLSSQNNNNNIVLINSLQWFNNSDGISKTNFQSTFSPVQFYGYLDNEKISQENKIKYAQRVAELLPGASQYSEELLYAKLFLNDNSKSDFIKTILKPYFSIKKYVVGLKDKGLLYKKLRTLPNKKNIDNKSVNWKEEAKKASEEGEKLASNNEFLVLDTYYDKNLKDNLTQAKNSDKNINLLNSKEFEDYELYLDTCVDLGIKPYIILAPTNGLWYDYTGITKEKRQALYSKVELMAKEKGFEVLNLQDEEYTPHFMVDVMHLGWKGWLKVDEEIYNKYK